MTSSIFNPALHTHLTELGYVFTSIAADWMDVGGAENGPLLHGHPAYNEYLSPDEVICIDEFGHVASRETRDLEFEQWCDAMGQMS